jgi:hypothetical protein
MFLRIRLLHSCCYTGTPDVVPGRNHATPARAPAPAAGISPSYICRTDNLNTMARALTKLRSSWIRRRNSVHITEDRSDLMITTRPIHRLSDGTAGCFTCSDQTTTTERTFNISIANYLQTDCNSSIRDKLFYVASHSVLVFAICTLLHSTFFSTHFSVSSLQK